MVEWETSSLIKIVRPGIVRPSSSLATRPNDDCEVGMLLSRELGRKSRSGCLSTSSRFFDKVHVNVTKKRFTNNTICGIIPI